MTDEIGSADSKLHAPASLIEVGLAQGWLELAEGADVEALEKATNEAELGPNPQARADAIMQVWLDHDAVEEVYVSDDDLYRFLKKW